MTGPRLRSSGLVRLASVACAALLWTLPAAAQGPPAGPSVTGLEGALRLTKDDVAYLALLNSRDLKVERFNTRIAEQEVPTEQAAFHPIVSIENSEAQSTNLAGSALAGAETIENETTSWSSGVRARFISGAVASFDFVNSRLESNNQFLTINPQYNSTLTFTLTQPLLRGFGPSANLWRIKVAENTVKMSRYQLQAKVANVLADAESTYWDLALAFKSVEIREKALELTRQLAKRTEELVAEGLLPETALLQARTTVLQREGDLLVAGNMRTDAARRLQNLLNVGPGSDTLIVPLEQPAAERKTIDITQAVKDALARRPELPQAQLDLKNKDVLLGFAKNQTLPQLNLFGSYGWSGLAGEASAQTSPTVTVPITRRQSVTVSISDAFPSASNAAVGDYGTALDNLFTGDYPIWRVGVNLTFALGNVAAESQLRRAQLEMQRAEIGVKNVEQAIALEVERLGQQIQSTFKAIEVARALREQAQRRLDVTRDQFQLGLVSLSTVVEAQRDLVTAEQEEWRAVTDYDKVLVQFERATGALPDKYRVDL